MMEISFEDTMSNSGKDEPVDLIWRQIMKSVCVDLRLCDGVVHVADSDIYSWRVKLR